MVWATLISPLRNLFFRSVLMSKFLAPPVTDINKLGGWSFQ